MGRIVVNIGAFPAALRKHVKGHIMRELRAAAVEAVARGEAEAVRLTNADGLVDQGLYKASWKHRATLTGGELRNDAPYAGVIEFGRRPGAPGPPYAPILEWVNRKLVANGEVEPEEAEDVARAIQFSIHRNGSPPHFIMGETARKLRGYLRDAIKRRNP